MLPVEAESRTGAPEALSVAYYEHKSRPSVNVIQVCKRSQLAMCQDARIQEERSTETISNMRDDMC